MPFFDIDALAYFETRYVMFFKSTFSCVTYIWHDAIDDNAVFLEQA